MGLGFLAIILILIAAFTKLFCHHGYGYPISLFAICKILFSPPDAPQLQLTRLRNDLSFFIVYRLTQWPRVSWLFGWWQVTLIHHLAKFDDRMTHRSPYITCLVTSWSKGQVILWVVASHVKPPPYQLWWS